MMNISYIQAVFNLQSITSNTQVAGEDRCLTLQEIDHSASFLMVRNAKISFFPFTANEAMWAVPHTAS